MRKVFVFLALISLFGISILAQSSTKTRPRVVKINPRATPTTPTKQENSGARKKPELQNTTGGTAKRLPPVLINPNARTNPAQGNGAGGTGGDDEIITVETNLVTLPVTVLDKQGRFVSGVAQREFKVFDNGVEQRIEYFAPIEKAFTVVLLLDVSPSTNYRIDEIHQAAITFINQLRPDDMVMVVAFDRGYNVLTRPTNDRYRIRSAIEQARFGGGTSLYDAVSRTIVGELRSVPGRKAVVLFTDGVDTTSATASIQSTLRQVEEVDALMYPIRYDTYSGYTGNPKPTGTRGQRKPKNTGNIFGDILAGIILGGNINIGSAGGGQSAEEYRIGQEYLGNLARYSGGRMFEADTTRNLDAAFRSIAEELRMQYSLGYYPIENGTRGDRRQIRVRVMRANLVVRTKRAYIVGGSGT